MTDYLAAQGRKGGAARAKALTPRQRKRIASAGGKASAAKLTAEERQAKALKAIRARWAEAKKKPPLKKPPLRAR